MEQYSLARHMDERSPSQNARNPETKPKLSPIGPH